MDSDVKDIFLMNDNELREYLEKLDEEINETGHKNNTALEIIHLIDKKKEIEAELNRRLKYIKRELL